MIPAPSERGISIIFGTNVEELVFVGICANKPINQIGAIYVLNTLSSDYALYSIKVVYGTRNNN